MNNKFNPETHHRNSIRLRGYDYSQSGLYFITICTNNKEHLFGEIMDGKMILNKAGKMINKCWNEVPNHFANTELHEYVSMPNHFHAIIEITNPQDQVQCEADKVNWAPTRDAPTKKLGEIIGSFKSISTVQYIRGVKDNLWKSYSNQFWQRNYWERIIRNELEFNKISQYIVDNPACWEDDKLNGGVGNLVLEHETEYNRRGIPCGYPIPEHP